MTRSSLLSLCFATLAGAPSAGSAAGAKSDGTLTPREYVAAGFPATDRTWTPREYAPVLDTLEKLRSKRGDGVLPRAGSARSGPVFTRMVDRRNFDVAADRSLPVGVRFPMVVGAMQPIAGTLKLYLAAHLASSAQLEPELLALQCLMLDAARRSGDLAGELPVPAAGSEGRARFDAGVAQMRQGEAEVVIGGLHSFSGAKAGADRTRFAACLAEEVPGSIPHLTGEARLEIRNLVARAADAEPAGSDAKPHLARLAASLAANR